MPTGGSRCWPASFTSMRTPKRHHLGFARPKGLPDVLLDEAETSIHASFHGVLRRKDREDLVEDARDRLIK